MTDLRRELAGARDIAHDVQRQLEGLQQTHGNIPLVQQVLNQAINDLKRSAAKNDSHPVVAEADAGAHVHV